MQKKPCWKRKKGEPSLRFFLNLLILPVFLLADSKGPLDSKSINNSFKQEEETSSNAALKGVTQNFTQTHPSSDVMIVDPKIVSQDWIDAFLSLKAKKLTDITFLLRDNSQISDVSHIEALPGGYLMLFSLKTIQGTKYKIVKTSDLSSIISK